MKRREFLASFLATGACLGGTDAFLIEPNSLDVTHHYLNDRTSRSQSALFFVQITDLHLEQVGYIEQRVAEETKRFSPSFIVITGDSVNSNEQLNTLRQFLALLPPEIPKYATLGNWEHWGNVDFPTLSQIYEQAGGTLLINDTAIVEQNGSYVVLTGMDDSTAGDPDFNKAMDGVQPANAHIVLAHSPIYRDDLPGDIDSEVEQHAPGYMLSGHTHGGQVDLFGYKPFLPPGTGRYVEGWFRDRRPYLYVSRGIGTSIVPVRFGARPELSTFTIWI